MLENTIDHNQKIMNKIIQTHILLDKFNYFDKNYVSNNITYSFSRPIQLTLEEARIIVFHLKIQQLDLNIIQMKK